MQWVSRALNIECIYNYIYHIKCTRIKAENVMIKLKVKAREVLTFLVLVPIK